MSSKSATLRKMKNDFINHMVYYYNIESSLTHSVRVNNYLFDNLSTLSNVVLNAEDIALLNDYSHSEDKKQERFIKESLSFLVQVMQETRNKKASRLKIVTSSSVPTLKEMFVGLAYEGNNDASFDDLPSALSLNSI